MKRKVLSVLLAVCLLTGCLPLAAEAEEKPTSGKCGSNVTWSLDTSTGELVIEGAGPMEDYFYDEYRDNPGDSFWASPWGYENPDIRSVVVKPGVTSIADYAFILCRNLTSVTLPDTVTRIGDSAFDGCVRLPEIALPRRLDYLGSYALSNTDLTSVEIPEGLTRIEEGVFCHDDKLVSVTIPDGVVNIDDWAFYGCRFTTVILPDSVKTIGDCSFANLTITSINLPESLTYIDEDAFYGCDLTSITIPSHVTGIRKLTFGHCYSLASVTLPNGMTSIGEEAFFDCRSLSSITLPDSVIDIGTKAFARCSGLTSVTIPESVTHIGEDVFDGCGDELTIYGTAGSYAETYANENNIPFVSVQPSAPGPVTPVTPAEPDPAPAAPGFIDVPSGAYYADAVQWAAENGIAGGTDETHFSPDDPCTRAQAVTFLWRAAGKPEPQGAAVPFTDIKAGAYYEKAVQWAVENGITSGTSEIEFSPDSTCTRAQIVAFLYRAENSPAVTGENSFSDVAANAYYKNAVQWAAEKEITSGTGGNQFSPDDTCVRGQVVTFLYRYSK